MSDPVIKEGSIVKMKENSSYLDLPIPRWTKANMVYRRISQNIKGSKSNHVGKLACHSLNLKDYWFISESDLEVIENPVTQLSLFD